jgi:hypothetical protein
LAVLNADVDGPMTRFLGSAFPQFTAWWNTGNVSLPVKSLLLAVAAWVALTQTSWLIPATILVGVIYLLYYTTSAACSPGAVAMSRGLLEREAKRAECSLVRKWVAKRPPIDRFTELVGSLLGGAVSCIGLSYFGLILGGTLRNPSIESWSLYLWITITSIACCWAALLTGKAWESRDESEGFRRMTMVLTGFLIGVFSYGVARFLHADLGLLAMHENRNAIARPIGLPFAPPTACVLVFSVLFGLLRWWRQADPLRRTRVSIWSVGLCMMWAIVLCGLFSLPTVSGCILAFAVSISIQFASPWLHPDQRNEVCHPQTASENP